MAIDRTQPPPHFLTVWGFANDSTGQLGAGGVIGSGHVEVVYGTMQYPWLSSKLSYIDRFEVPPTSTGLPGQQWSKFDPWTASAAPVLPPAPPAEGTTPMPIDPNTGLPSGTPPGSPPPIGTPLPPGTPDPNSPPSAPPTGTVPDTAVDFVGGVSLRLTVNDPRLPTVGIAKVVRLTPMSVAFYFTDPGNLEVFAKVIDGRAFNNCFWVFSCGMTDVACTLTAIMGSAKKEYTNISGTAFATNLDTSAFPAS